MKVFLRHLGAPHAQEFRPSIALKFDTLRPSSDSLAGGLFSSLAYYCRRGAALVCALTMGKGIMGESLYACMEPGCECVDFECVVATWTDEERAMRIVHHPRNSPWYLQCSCGHHQLRHFKDPASRAVCVTVPLATLSELFREYAPAQVGWLEAVEGLGCSLGALAGIDRPDLLNRLRAAGVALADRQAIATAVGRARTAGRISLANHRVDSS